MEPSLSWQSLSDSQTYYNDLAEYYPSDLQIAYQLAEGSFDFLPLRLKKFTIREKFFEEMKRLVNIVAEKRSMANCIDINELRRGRLIDEEEPLILVLKQNTDMTWAEIVKYFPGRSAWSLMNAYNTLPDEQLLELTFLTSEESKHLSIKEVAWLRKMARGQLDEFQILFEENDTAAAEECAALLRALGKVKLRAIRARDLSVTPVTTEESLLIVLLWEHTNLSWEDMSQYFPDRHDKTGDHQKQHYIANRNENRLPIFAWATNEDKKREKYTTNISEFGAMKNMLKKSGAVSIKAEEMDELGHVEIDDEAGDIKGEDEKFLVNETKVDLFIKEDVELFSEGMPGGSINEVLDGVFPDNEAGGQPFTEGNDDMDGAFFNNEVGGQPYAEGTEEYVNEGVGQNYFTEELIDSYYS